MYFKKLELFGFKSFVDKTTLLFEPGVTAIVGPNGTGKSNISDAIKWVLGEQSAKSMRGAKMEDVIFNGTAARPPVNLCEVSLTLSNEEKLLPIDYDEVTITRRLYRSGESEYLLNKTPVRLKDISELLMGTGIGTESYSLLEQGRIDSIISSRPEDRRIIFEEASGITRFKKKKNEAMRRLEQTEENLLRVKDIVVEVTRQLGSIQRQVSKARRYQEHYEQLKAIDTQYTYREYTILNSERSSLETDEGQFRSEQEQIEQDLVNFSQLFDGVKDTLSQVENDYKDITSKVMIAQTQVEKNTDRINLNKERIDEFTQRVNTALVEIENLGRKIDELQEQRAHLQERITVFQEEKNTKEHNLNLKQNSLTELEKLMHDAQETIKQVKVMAVNLLAEHAQIRNNMAKLSADINNSNARLTRLRQEKAKTSEELEEINASLFGKVGELELLRARLLEEQDKEFQLRNEQEKLSIEIKKLVNEISSLTQELIAKQSQLSVLEDLNKSYEGFSSSVKALMTKRDEFPEQFEGVHDVLVNLIDVAPGYELCVESVLADYLQVVVVEDRQVMMRLRDFVTTQQIGRIRIMALDAIQMIEISDINNEQITALNKFIDCKDRYKKLIAYLCKHSFVVKNTLQKQSTISLYPEPEEKPSQLQGPQQVNDGIRFSYYAAQVEAIYVVGDFNDWRITQESCLTLTGPGVWTGILKLSPGRYRYKLIVDGKWITDPSNPQTESDITGNTNSIIEVKQISKTKEIDWILLESLVPGVLLVTLLGEMYSRTEIVSKPTAENNMGLISQKVQMKHLKEDCIAIEGTIDILNKQEIVDREKLEQVENDLTQVTEVVHEEKLIFANKDSERANIGSTKKKLEEELSIIQLEIEETTLDNAELIAKEVQNKEKLEKVDLEIQQNDVALNQSLEQIFVKTSEREELLVIIAEKKTEFSLVNEQEAALNANLSILDESFSQYQANKEDTQRQREEAERRMTELSAQVLELEELTAKKQEEKHLSERELEQISQQRNALLEDFENMQKQIREKENRLNAIKNKIRDFDVRKVELNFKLDALENNVYQSYKVDLTTVVMEIPDDVNWQQQKNEIDFLKQKVDRLGSVNLAAVEEEEELRERAEFLNSQKEDLVTAKESLMQAIRKINKTTKVLFMETFEKAQVAFKEYYKLLFGGGDAQLYLDVEKDVLESGIDISVRPPGKRLQSITLLSGGEKTLTAIALLFAIFKIKPTPFCVLDEMDAPLDEANIDRFTRVLQEFLKNSQFIIITHNKKTISMADVMYGVTMEQSGVSKLVSVKFAEYKEPPKKEIDSDQITIPVEENLEALPAEKVSSII